MDSFQFFTELSNIEKKLLKLEQKIIDDRNSKLQKINTGKVNIRKDIRKCDARKDYAISDARKSGTSKYHYQNDIMKDVVRRDYTMKATTSKNDSTKDVARSDVTRKYVTRKDVTLKDATNVNVSSDASVQINDLKKQLRDLQLNDACKPTISFSDIKASLNTFNGDDNYNIKNWIADTERSATLYGWNDLQHLTYAKLLLRGTAKKFLRTIYADSWIELKDELFDQFNDDLSEAQLLVVEKLIADHKAKIGDIDMYSDEKVVTDEEHAEEELLVNENLIVDDKDNIADTDMYADEKIVVDDEYDEQELSFNENRIFLDKEMISDIDIYADEKKVIDEDHAEEELLFNEKLIVNDKESITDIDLFADEDMFIDEFLFHENQVVDENEMITYGDSFTNQDVFIEELLVHENLIFDDSCRMTDVYLSVDEECAIDNDFANLMVLNHKLIDGEMYISNISKKYFLFTRDVKHLQRNIMSKMMRKMNWKMKKMDKFVYGYEDEDQSAYEDDTVEELLFKNNRIILDKDRISDIINPYPLRGRRRYYNRKRRKLFNVKRII